MQSRSRQVYISFALIFGLLCVYVTLVTFSGLTRPVIQYAAAGNIFTRVVKSETGTPAILFIGDILLARDVERKMLEHGVSHPFLGVNSLFKEAAVVANFEASVPNAHLPTPDLSTVFSVDSELLDGLAGSGVTHLSLANNHSFDYGTVGFNSTSQVLERRGFDVFGHPQQNATTTSVSYISLAGTTIALIALNDIVPGGVSHDWRAVLTEASAHSDRQIVFIHWGEEYQTTHSKRQEELAYEFVAAGVDAIIGHHPHVVQDIGFIHDVPVFYSLGNFIFDQYFSESVQEGLVVRLDANNAELGFSLIPVSSLASRAQPHPMGEADRSRFLSELAKQSDQTLFSDISTGFIAWKSTKQQFAISPRIR
ncbi:MAG: CapA family protein [Candidatus Paceibacterota bacterium]